MQKTTTSQPYPQHGFATIQIIGSYEERENLLALLRDEQRKLIAEAVEQVRSEVTDPLQGHPLVASADYWARLKGKSGGGTYTGDTFRTWAKKNGHDRVKNGMYARNSAKEWLFGKQ